MAISKLERLLDLVAELLHTRRPLTAEELHERIPGYPEDRDSFKRAFERDKADLREMDIPVRVETVPGRLPAVDGYRIDRDEYGLPDPGLEPDELAAIHLAASAVRVDGTSARTGLRKLGGLLGDDAADGAAILPSAPHMAESFAAVAEHRRLEFRYREKDRIVDPLRLHHERGHWYLQGHDHGAGDLRSFRLDRIEGVLVAGDEDSAVHTEIPPERDIRLDAWALGDDEPIDALVRVDRKQAGRAARLVGDDVVREWQDDGGVLLHLPVRRIDGLRSFVLGFLDDAEVLGPRGLRDDMEAWLASIADEGRS